MTRYAAFLRAVNVGGTGKLAMADLRALAESLGFRDVATYIQSGNLVFSSEAPSSDVQSRLESGLEKLVGKPVKVLLRTETEMGELEPRNPFPEADPSRVMVIFLPRLGDSAVVERTKPPGGEVLRLLGRELWIYFPDGMGKSKLKIPYQDEGTARNLHTVRKVLALTGRPYS